MSPSPHELLNPPRAVRADAARNREAILNAARKIIEDTGDVNFSMDELASAARVGKGTIFRRFENRQGVLDALLDYRTQKFQHDFMFGPPPLGPGAPARDRLLAFGAADIAFNRSLGPLAAATAGQFRGYFSHPARRLTSTHLTMLLREAGFTGDTEVANYTLLAFLNPGGLDVMQADLDVTPERLATGWTELINGLLD